MVTSDPIYSILYIDDEENNLTSFKSTFRRDYHIHVASTGQEGLEIMEKHNIQLVITDQRMPDMTGIEFLEKIVPLYPDCMRMLPKFTGPTKPSDRFIMRMIPSIRSST